jgi:FkbM family methyltransferase
MGYSQSDEETVIFRYFEDNPEKINGTGVLLDIGAFDGRNFSNSLAMIEKGWKACLVEASSFSFSKCYMEHRLRENVTLVNTVLTANSEQNKLIEFYESPNSAVSTLDGNNLWYKEDTKEYLKHRKIYTTSIGFMDFMAWCDVSGFNKIDFLTIDVEGISADFSMMFDPDKYQTSLVCVEKDKKDEEIIQYYSKFGFKKIYNSSENIIIGRI